MVGGRPYEIACNEGDEERILSLSESLNQRVSKTSLSLGVASDAMALLVTGLMMEDEIRGLRNNQASRNPPEISDSDIQMRINRCITEALAPFTEKLEALAKSLEVE